ncbi:helix-turn-helix transcriptional regulator [Leisingera daeponensis]|uniref:helix-turn-helix transcriptional regulator n=1 Tax=Leisingera daeponensis TaxID=405746 RepID=UPI001C96B2A9|nr:autoinducer binding domain-containing protein [Leisingera daeponensis]MBY6058888.1 autoinducer binding domain-containing protein [Leisingera daeponensis]
MSSLLPSSRCQETASGKVRDFLHRAEQDVRGARGISGSAVELLDEIESAASLDVLRHQITPLINQCFNADHIIYHGICSSGRQFGWGTYPEEWISRYLEQGYIRVDPVIQRSRNCFHPIDWQRLDWSHVSVRKFFADAQAHGIGNQGFSIPIRGPHGQFAVFSVNRSCSDEAWHEFTSQRTRDLILTAHAFNERVLQLQPDLVPQAIPHLCKREIDALALLARGCGRAEAAAKLNISESTLRTYIETARSKLSAANTTQAVAIAASRGLIAV